MAAPLFVARNRDQAIFHISFAITGFNLEVQQNIIRLAPEGRDVYSTAVVSLIRSSGKERNRFARLVYGFAGESRS